LPDHEAWHAGEAANTLIDLFRQRYDAARKAAEEQWDREQLLNPVDDAAWEQELLPRKQIEDWDADDRAHPEGYTHNV
jgi:chorismate mutase